MMKINSQCRDCDSKKLVKFLDLDRQPPANSFLNAEQLRQTEPVYPLQVYFCSDCHLVQLIHVVDKDELFRHYVYFSSEMPKVSSYWQSYAENVIGRFLKNRNDLVVEVGSNDGVLLEFFKNSGFRVLGIDPAENIAKVAEARGVPTLTEFFDLGVVEKAVKDYGQARAILANNVVAHIDDHQDLCAGVHAFLHREGVWVIEAPYLIDMFENLTYDTVYHEHLSFLAVRPLQKLFEKYGLEIFDVQVVPAQGQSIRLFIGHQDVRPVGRSVTELVQKELDFRLDRTESYFELAQRVKNSKDRLLRILTDLKKQGKKIAAYGAPAKGNTLLNYCKIGSGVLDYVLDELPSKQGLYTPGRHLPVVTKEFAATHPPDYYLLLAWNYQQAVLDKEQPFIQRGGKFIIPVGDDPKIL